MLGSARCSAWQPALPLTAPHTVPLAVCVIMGVQALRAQSDALRERHSLLDVPYTEHPDIQHCAVSGVAGSTASPWHHAIDIAYVSLRVQQAVTGTGVEPWTWVEPRSRGHMQPINRCHACSPLGCAARAAAGGCGMGECRVHAPPLPGLVAAGMEVDRHRGTGREFHRGWLMGGHWRVGCGNASHVYGLRLQPCRPHLTV